MQELRREPWIASLPPPLIEQIMAPFESDQALFDCGAGRLAIIVPGIGAEPDEIAKALKHRQNIFKFAARASAALVPLLDGSLRAHLRALITEERYIYDWQRVRREFALGAMLHNRWFDEGNRKTVGCLDGIRTRAYDTLRDEALNDWEVPLPPCGVTDEVPSHTSLPVQASDFAAGLARDAYEAEGLVGVKRHFHRVLLNGELV